MKNLPFSKLKLLLLGSGELGKELVIEAKRLGCDVIAVDKYENAPAMQVADKHFVLDMSNNCLLYTSPSPRDIRRSRMPSSA